MQRFALTGSSVAQRRGPVLLNQQLLHEEQVLWLAQIVLFSLCYEALWDQLLEGRIKMQKALVTVNRLPQPDTYPVFRKEGGQEFDNAVENCKNSSIFLLWVDSAVANMFCLCGEALMGRGGL